MRVRILKDEEAAARRVEEYAGEADPYKAPRLDEYDAADDTDSDDEHRESDD